MKPALSFLLLILVSISVPAQTQDEFMAKISDVYVNTADKKKALDVAKSALEMVEKKKELQTYANYATLKVVFENQLQEAELAKQCQEKADKALNAMVGAQQSQAQSDDPLSKWNNELYPALFATSDKQNAVKATQFLAKHPALQTFNNLTYVGYAYERNGDFENAKKSYEQALNKVKDEKNEYHSYLYYTNFLSQTGEYLKAEEYIKKMEKLSEESSDYFKTSYKAESLGSKVVYYLAIGDYASFIQVSLEQLEYFKNLPNKPACDTYAWVAYTHSAYAKEMLKDYAAANELWQKRDSSHYAWINCNNKLYPNYQQYPLSYLPVFQMKSGRKSALSKPLHFFIDETEKHYTSYSAFHEMRINHMRATQLAFLGSQKYHELFKGVLDQIENTKDFREATVPFANYAYFNMRDRMLDKSSQTYERLFKLNVNWINDVIFTFGEKAFVTYYNTKLKEGYDNYHSFVKLAKDGRSPLFGKLASQAYDNLLFTKSLSLKGTQKRKQAFRKANDPSILKMYDEWIDKKQQLIRLYRRAEDAATAEHAADQTELKKLQDEVNHLEDELTAKAKDFKKYLKLTPPDWKTIKASLKDGEAAIEMIRFQWRDQLYYSDTTYYAAYFITKNSVHPDVIYLPASAADLENKFYKFYQNSIKAKLPDNNSYQNYFKPILDQLKGVKKIYFSPDGIYHLINIPTLFNPDTKKYILDEIDFQYTTSSADLQDVAANPTVRTAVLFGRPSYEVSSGSQILSSVSHETRSFVASFRENNISDLPGTEEEVLSIKKEMDKNGIQSTMYLKDHATEDKIYKLNQPDILHIATHGYWSQAGNSTDGFRLFNAMVNSGLLMSGVVNYYRTENFPDTYDGILTAYEAQNLNLENTSLVILSACETSLGHMDAGEGVYGLQRAFRAAGAKSIMTSLWKVDDAATKEFMILFYENYLSSKNKFAAFQTAQKKLKEKFPEPYYWGAFVLTGN